MHLDDLHFLHNTPSPSFSSFPLFMEEKEKVVKERTVMKEMHAGLRAQSIATSGNNFKLTNASVGSVLKTASTSVSFPFLAVGGLGAEALSYDPPQEKMKRKLACCEPT